ncbi:MAG: serine/threonine protein kinase [Myxococcota bacterium]|nr:serine/threonine protein kinase [Myxococcota bacterium]MDW8363861.1 serine/threonine-protein kinase [Myxococcales bacterium]
MTARAALGSGERVGAYRIVRRMAEGGMGAVYEAIDAAGGRVALKVLHAEHASDPEVRRRFRRESSVLGALEHPCIVRVLDMGTDEASRCYTVMELLEGETLEARLARTPALGTSELAAIVRGICEGLECAHAHGVVHGDLKPANVFLPVAGPAAVKLLDFGLSKILGLERLTRTGELRGTPAYMAPELLTGERDVDRRADVYAVGVILYRALSGRLPFVERNPGRLLFEVVTGRCVPLRQARPDVPPALERVVARAMAVRPADRFETARELGEAFERAIASRP